MLLIPLLLCAVLCCVTVSNGKANYSRISLTKSRVWGPGLYSDFNVPVRYFFIQAVDHQGSNLTESIGEPSFTVLISPSGHARARIWTQVLNRHDGSYVVRYRLYETVEDLAIRVQLGDLDVADSPYILKGAAYHEKCNCPRQSADEWAESVGCPATYEQIKRDLAPFSTIDMKTAAKEAVKRFNQARRHSLCHYTLRNNKVYRKCYGEHVGFNMFTDAILLSLTRKMILPDLDLLMNLGDWPLETDRHQPLPIMSWCGSKDSMDIVLPTYDITEATLEMMGRVSLDIFSTQANTGPTWSNKSNLAFWRGRDSRRERLQLVETARKHPEMIDAALTNMFFFPKDEQKYGKIQKHVSFFDFFMHKYQLNIDGTVAAYRLPYLLAGDSVVFKQDSSYYEHFYHELEPMVHYVPVKSDLSDLLDKLRWARQNDEEVHRIAQNGQQYVRDRLNPADVLCYYVRLYQEFSKRLKNTSANMEGFERVEQPVETTPCTCTRKTQHQQQHQTSKREEL